ncbi:alpha/beta hydrolase [Litoreibacter arenae]|uniref:Identified by similarity to GB.1 n=1 Tax=Litoreibacter arenae DSM 19593 TaxID=1123360 RepID=S9QK96_9RHOB|nr:alpha/beta fold hydrolase [Litoreibacter arenae]EPX80008.1 identified by similarity to GB.1 [Litoreibacter arenae DSM 19593]
MQTFGKWLGRILLALVILGVVIWLFVPREPVDTEISFDPSVIGDDIDAYLAREEAQFDDITEGVEKRVIWADEVAEQTPLSIVYIHGFSATSEEIRPVPDKLADQLGANLFYTRLTGHGRGGLAMAEPVAGDWLEDTAEALAIGRRIGQEVIVIATSTGGTAAAIAATDPALMERVKSIAMVSPNFRVRSPAAVILDWPLARSWAAMVAGAERSFAPINDAHGKYWTTLYPTSALIPMAALVRHAREADYSQVTTPALFIFSDEDGVVSAETTRAVSTKWGGPVQLAPRELGEGDDPFNHVIAGDILSPGQTDATVALLRSWVDGL